MAERMSGSHAICHSASESVARVSFVAEPLETRDELPFLFVEENKPLSSLSTPTVLRIAQADLRSLPR
jgi:hypothetical protein